jgi:hypothetical protein
MKKNFLSNHHEHKEQQQTTDKPHRRSLYQRWRFSFVNYFILTLISSLKYSHCKHFHKKYQSFFDDDGHHYQKCNKCDYNVEVGAIELRSFWSYLTDYWD